MNVVNWHPIEFRVWQHSSGLICADHIELVLITHHWRQHSTDLSVTYLDIHSCRSVFDNDMYVFLYLKTLFSGYYAYSEHHSNSEFVQLFSSCLLYGWYMDVSILLRVVEDLKAAGITTIASKILSISVRSRSAHFRTQAVNNTMSTYLKHCQHDKH